MSLKDSTDKLNELMQDRRDLHIGWLKQLLIIASGVSSILVSLQGTSNKSSEVALPFVLIVALLSIGILGLAIALYGHVHLARRLQSKMIEAIQQQLRENSQNHESFSVNPPSIFSIAEVVGYAALACSLICFVWYSFEISGF